MKVISLPSISPMARSKDFACWCVRCCDVKIVPMVETITENGEESTALI
jgi:hypothetical protein